MKFILIIPAILKPQAEAFSKQIDPLSVGEDFTTPLRLVGSSEPTHFASLPNVTDEPVIAAIRQLTASELFIASGGLSRECTAPEARRTFLELLAANGLEEVPAEAEG